MEAIARGEMLSECAALIRRQRWAALATADETGAPVASMVAYALHEGTLLLHLSRLAAHTRHLLARTDGSLVISEPDRDDVTDPQTLARVSLTGAIRPLEAEGEEFCTARAAYLRRLPEADMRFGFSDFVLFRLTPEQARHVGGFARAATFSAAELNLRLAP